MESAGPRTEFCGTLLGVINYALLCREWVGWNSIEVAMIEEQCLLFKVVITQ